eukprot:scaffold325_cov343-Pavlova_lutheri.AAC.13
MRFGCCPGDLRRKGGFVSNRSRVLLVSNPVGSKRTGRVVLPPPWPHLDLHPSPLWPCREGPYDATTG